MGARGRGRLRQEIPYTLGDAGISFESCIGRTQVISNSGLVQISAIGTKDRIALLNQIIGSPCRQSLYGEAGICRALCREDAAIADKQIRNIVGTTEFVDDRGGRIASHAGGADQMSKARESRTGCCVETRGVYATLLLKH